jgi:hypothetical protein
MDGSTRVWYDVSCHGWLLKKGRYVNSMTDGWLKKAEPQEPGSPCDKAALHRQVHQTRAFSDIDFGGAVRTFIWLGGDDGDNH